MFIFAFKINFIMNNSENLTVSACKPRLFRWALWWGLGIVVACLAILLVYSFTNPESANELSSPLMNQVYAMVYQFGIWPIMLYIGLLGPIVEELSFRLWGNGKQWTGIVSIVLMALWSLNVGWWLPLLVSACGTSILVAFRDDKTKRLFALMLLSSVIFAVAHLGNYEGNKFIVIIGVLHKLGFGLVASYLVINHNLLWSMGFHALNNGILAIPLGLAFGQVSQSVETIENGSFQLEVRPVLVHNDSICEENRFFFDTDTNYYFGSAASFAEQALYYEAGQKGIVPNSDTVKFVTESGYPNCSFKLIYKTQPHNHQALLVALEDAKLIDIDTTYDSDNHTTVLNIKSTYDPLSKGY